ncbi:hypothetical protein BGX33_001222 [Mortierella sp. NVP41]|nr:hypothetical protein BGX33_001222 [Mortierella sp. NVP41]
MATLNLTCLISGEPPSKAFTIKVHAHSSVSNLKRTIVNENPGGTFAHITDAEDLALWPVTIPVDSDQIHRAVFLDEVFHRAELATTDTLSQVFRPPLPQDTIHILIERPNATSTPQQDHGSKSTRIAELQKEIKGLHRSKRNTALMNVVLQPNHSSKAFLWTTDTATTSLKEFREAIYHEYPDRQDYDANAVVLAVLHDEGRIERPNNDAQFRNIVEHYRTNTRLLTVALETPTKKYTDHTLTDVNKLYGICSDLDAPRLLDLPRFEGITREALYTDLHEVSLRRLVDELDSRVRAVPADIYDEASCSAYVCSFLAPALLIFNGDLKLVLGQPLRGRHGHGKIDYSVEALDDSGMKHTLIVTVVKHGDHCRAVAQTIVQLGTLLARKQSRSNNDDSDGNSDGGIVVDNKPRPLKAYGIATDAATWYFVEGSIDPSQNLPSPKFRVSRLDDIVNYNKLTWSEEAGQMFGFIVWLMRKMHSEVHQERTET